MLEQMIESRKAEISDQQRKRDRACDVASQMVPFIKEQLAPMRALSDFKITRTGSTILVDFERKLPGAYRPSLYVDVKCDNLITVMAAVGTVASIQYRRGVSYAPEFSIEQIVQLALKTCEGDFKSMIRDWIR